MNQLLRGPDAGQVHTLRGAPTRSLRLTRRQELAQARPQFGYHRIWLLLRREGWPANKNHVRRMYRLEGLQGRMRVRRRKHRALHRGPAPVPGGPQERWSMDFVHDQLADGQPFRVLRVVAQWSRQSPLPEVAQRFSGFDVAVVLDRVISTGRPPRSITVDHGTDGRGSPWGMRTSHRLTDACATSA